MKKKAVIRTDEELLYSIAESTAKKYYIQGYTTEDLVQEGYILGMELLKKYNQEKGKLENFLRVSLNNAMQNFVRSKTVNQKPCGCLPNNYCKKCRYLEGKARVIQATQFPDDIELINQNAVKECFADLLPLINQHLPASMRQDWRKILEDSHVVKSRRAEIFDEIREIVKEFENRNYETVTSSFEFGWENGYFFIENDEHLVKIYMDEEMADMWLHRLSPNARQSYKKLRECGSITYDEVVEIANCVDKLGAWDV